jgi:hypothetical protein
MTKKLSKILSKTIAVSLLGSLVASCATAEFTDLPLIDSEFTKPKVTAYKRFGFDFDAMPANVQNIDGINPTEFSVNLFIGNNDNCEVLYVKSKDGKKDRETKSTSFNAYLSEKNTLLKVICAGKDSNIDYKITAKANGIKYTHVGNLSYLEESSEI